MNDDAFPPYLAVLNPEQREAVLHTGNPELEGQARHPLLILAGAGSGKTRVITTKIAYLIREQQVDPHSILAVTFTNKAAREMAERARLIDDRAAYAMLRTFHSFGAWFLRRNGSLLGLPPGFVIYDDDDTVALLSAIIGAEDGEDKEKDVKDKKKTLSEVKQFAYHIARSKDYFLSPDDPQLSLINPRPEFRKVYAKYEERLAQIGNVDFGDLIKKPVDILRQYPEVARRFRDRFSVILVDEYQDANIAQFELLKELCGPQTYLCVVGDDDQSIYRFRGAEVRNILEFPERFSGTDIIRLERNYRSTVPILRIASSVVDHNQGRLGKTLRAERGAGKKPVLAFLPDQDEEAAFCAQLIASSMQDGKEKKYSDWAVLYRTNAQSLGFETEFLRHRIPYRVVGSLKFYEREEIKDALALLSFAVNPRDEVAFRRVANKPARGVGAATLARVIGDSLIDAEAPGDLAAAARRLINVLPAKAASGLKVFLTIIETGRAALNTSDLNKDADSGAIGTDKAGKTQPRKKAEKRQETKLQAGEGLSVCVVKLVQEAGLAEYHLSHDEFAGNQRIANLQELANAASLYSASEAGLAEFLEHIELDRSMEDESAAQDVVTLITLHNTKGLEFRRVIMTGIEQGVFPREDKSGEELEEERRLFYVGATRAMDELYFCTCDVRRMYGRTMPMAPSQFLAEMDRTDIRIVGTPPYGYSFPQAQRKPQAQKVKTAGGWQVGDRLFHDDHGYGSVLDIEDGEEGPVVRVRFDVGGELRFQALHPGSRITRVAE